MGFYWIEYIIIFILAFIVSFLFTPTAKYVAVRIGAVDVPKDSRRMHKKPVALMGGLAIIVGFLSTILFDLISALISELVRSFINSKFALPSVFEYNFAFLGVIIGILLIMAEGIIDDKFHVSFKIKLLLQFAAALAVVAMGTRISIISNPFSPVGYSQLNEIFSYAISIIWIVGITNAINLLDGLDGLAAGVSSIALLSLFAISVMLGQIPLAALCIAIAGSTLGFIPYNFNPAKIFMGETGSAFLGFMLAVVSIQGVVKLASAIAIAIPVLILGLPLFDTVFAFIRRLREGKPFWIPDRRHLHHTLVDMGLSHKQSVIAMYVTSGIFGLIAVVLADRNVISAMILLLSIIFFIIAGLKFFGRGESLLSKYEDENSIYPQANIKSFREKAIERRKDNSAKKLIVMTIFGTRPEAVKMAPLVKELEKNENIESLVCVTAQHRQMLDQVLEIFDIVPDYDLNIMKDRQTLIDITSRVIEGLGTVLDRAAPDIVLVHGDTTTTFAGSLAAFYKQISVGHVEAGLRTFDKYSPYPEEMNRKLTCALTDLHFAPTDSNSSNLTNEGVNGNIIYVTGNTVIDALKCTVNENYEFENEVLESIDFKSNRVITVTAHRRENIGEPLENICRAIRKIADQYEDVIIIYPVHLNPAVRETANAILGGHSRIHLIDPLAIQETHNLLNRSYLILTDSGGLQEEAPALGKPVLVLRNETERPEAVYAGTVKIAGTDEEKIFSMACCLLDSEEEYNAMAKAVNPYGDGNASARIVKALLYEYGYSDEKPEKFTP